jgi:hypothetical protein
VQREIDGKQVTVGRQMVDPFHDDRPALAGFEREGGRMEWRVIGRGRAITPDGRGLKMALQSLPELPRRNFVIIGSRYMGSVGAKCRKVGQRIDELMEVVVRVARRKWRLMPSPLMCQHWPCRGDKQTESCCETGLQEVSSGQSHGSIPFV